MIILAPTGLYRQVIPDGTESGAVTWSISNNEPPVSDYRVLQVPVIPRISVPSVLTNRRNFYGDRTFTILSSNAKLTASNKKLFEVGEVINFNDQELSSVTSVRTQDNFVIQHNTNKLDFKSMGLSDEEIDAITKDADEKMSLLKTQYNDINSEIKDTRSQISELQKTINEINKAINAVAAIYNSDNDIHERLSSKLEETINKQNTLVNSLNSKIVESQLIGDQLSEVSQLTR